MAKSSFNWLMTDTQKEIIELIITKEFDNNVSKSVFLWGLVYDSALTSLGIPTEFSLSDETILEQLRKEKDDRDEMMRKQLINHLGQEKYDELIAEDAKRGDK